MSTPRRSQNEAGRRRPPEPEPGPVTCDCTHGRAVALWRPLLASLSRSSTREAVLREPADPPRAGIGHSGHVPEQRRGRLFSLVRSVSPPGCLPTERTPVASSVNAVRSALWSLGIFRYGTELLFRVVSPSGRRSGMQENSTLCGHKYSLGTTPRSDVSAHVLSVPGVLVSFTLAVKEHFNQKQPGGVGGLYQLWREAKTRTEAESMRNKLCSSLFPMACSA